MDAVDTERETIWAEKSKLSTMARLETSTNTSTQRQIELDAAIQIAQVCQTNTPEFLSFILQLFNLFHDPPPIDLGCGQECRHRA